MWCAGEEGGGGGREKGRGVAARRVDTQSSFSRLLAVGGTEGKGRRGEKERGRVVIGSSGE